MRPVYSRTQRASIYDPATIGDIPPEVLRKAFIYLLPGEWELLASSISCRAWRPIALQLLYSYKFFRTNIDLANFVCGGTVSRLSDPQNVLIRSLSLDIENIEVCCFFGLSYT
jgi:hypothetical protein